MRGTSNNNINIATSSRIRDGKIVIGGICILFSTLFSCSGSKYDDLKKHDDSLLSKYMVVYGQYLVSQQDLKGARDSIKKLSAAIYQVNHLGVKTYAFVALEYEFNEMNVTKYGHCVGNVIAYDKLDSETQFRWMDSFAQSFLTENRIFRYRLTDRKVYTFNNYIDASKKRDSVYKNGIGSGKTIADFSK